MEALKSSFLYTIPINTPQLSSKPSIKKPNKILCRVSQDPWSLSDGNKPKPKSKHPKNPLSDDNARRIIKGKAQYLSTLRRNQGSQAQTPKWIKRTPEQMVLYLEDDRNGHLYGKHVVAAIKKVRSLSGKPDGSYNMRYVMSSFVAKLTFREMCIVLKEQKGWRQVCEFFGWMKLQLSYRPSVIVYTIVLRAYGQVGKVKLAEETFLEMLEVGIEADEVACGTMLCTYARWGRHKAMLSFYSALHERGITPLTPVFNFMLSSLQKKSLHQDVIYMWKQMSDKKVSPNHFTYTVVINSLVKEGVFEEAIKTFNEMKNLGFVPEEATYSLLISLSSKNGDRDKALWLYEDMRSKGLVPSNFTCASLLALYYKNGDYSKALSLFSEMELHKIVVDEVIYGLLIRIYGKLGLYEDAEKTFTDIERWNVVKDEKTYITMAQVHLHSGNIEKAVVIFDKMKSRNIVLSRFGLIVKLQCYIVKKDISLAEATFRDLAKTGSLDCGSCKNLLNMYISLNLSEKAREFIVQLRRDEVEFDEEVLSIMMKFYCKEGMERDVELLLEEINTSKRFVNNPLFESLLMIMQGKGKGKGKCVFNVTAFELILMLYLSNGNRKKTEEILKLMVVNDNGLSVAIRIFRRIAKEEGELSKAEYVYEVLIKLLGSNATTRKDLYTPMMEAYCKFGKEDDSYLFYKEEAQKGHHDLGPVSVSILINALTHRGKHVEAEEIIRNSFQLNVELDTIAYNSFIKAMLEAGKLHFASSIYERMVSCKVGCSIQTYNTMISVYGRQRNLDKAVEIFNTASTMGIPLDEKAYTNLISYYGKAGKTQQASHLFDDMQKQGIKPGKVSYNIMMSIYGSHGLYKQAEELFQKMLQPDTSTYLSLIRAYTKDLKYCEAENVINLMRKDGMTPCCAHFRILVMGYAKAGMLEEAERIYFKEIIVPDLECNRGMLRGYLDYGDVEKGISLFERIDVENGDRFIMSAAVHLYNSAGMELKAQQLLKSMDHIGVSFLDKLVVGSKKR